MSNSAPPKTQAQSGHATKNETLSLRQEIEQLGRQGTLTKTVERGGNTARREALGDSRVNVPELAACQSGARGRMLSKLKQKGQSTVDRATSLNNVPLPRLSAQDLEKAPEVANGYDAKSDGRLKLPLGSAASDPPSHLSSARSQDNRNTDRSCSAASEVSVRLYSEHRTNDRDTHRSAKCSAREKSQLQVDSTLLMDDASEGAKNTSRNRSRQRPSQNVVRSDYTKQSSSSSNSNVRVPRHRHHHTSIPLEEVLAINGDQV